MTQIERLVAKDSPRAVIEKALRSLYGLKA
jgi:adenine-specific DNA-methyltransferase